MTLLHADSFDTYTVNADLKQTYQVFSTGITVAQAGRISGSAIRIPIGRYLCYNVPGQPTTLIVGFAMYPVLAGNNDGRQFMYILNDIRGIIFQWLWYDQGMKFTIGSTTYSIGGVSEGWHYFEIKWVANTSTGSVTVNVDGVQVLSVTNVNTGSTGASIVQFNGIDNQRNANGVLMDDLYIADGGAGINSFLGPVKIRYFLPQANGDQNDWTASTGSNYTCVDDTPPFNTSDYVSTTGVGNIDNYSFNNVSGFDGSVKAVAVYLVATQTDVELKSIRATCKSSGTATTSAAQQTFNSYFPHEAIFEKDPNGTIAWTQSSVNAAYFGIKLES